MTKDVVKPEHGITQILWNIGMGGHSQGGRTKALILQAQRLARTQPTRRCTRVFATSTHSVTGSPTVSIMSSLLRRGDLESEPLGICHVVPLITHTSPPL